MILALENSLGMKADKNFMPMQPGDVLLLGPILVFSSILLVLHQRRKFQLGFLSL